jgi:CzcA family heavy metal efflux pump
VAQAGRIEDMKNAVVAYRDGEPLLLSQVADLRMGPGVPIGDATLNGQPAVVLLIARQPGVNTLTVTAEVDAVMDELSRNLPPRLRLHRDLFRQATFIERGLGNLRQALLIGGALVMLVLLLFLRDLRTALISLAAIPLSLLAALVVLRALGATVNTMTLAGLAVALGEVVDDSIIDVENIHRRLRENRMRVPPRPGNEVIFHASLEVRSSVVYATFLVALVFLPVLFLSGAAGRIFSPLAQAYVLATLASLGVALLVVPAASSLLLAGRAAQRPEGYVAASLKRLYGSILPGSLGHPKLLAAGAMATVFLSAAFLPFLGGEFLPPFQENDFIVHMTGLPGTSLEESLAVGKTVERRLSSVPGVLSVAQRAGRAELADEVSGPESSELDVRLSSNADEAEAVIRIRESLKDFPGFVFSVSQFFTERFEEVTGGEPAPVAVSVYGPDLDRLHDLGEAVVGVMGSIPGARDIRAESQAKAPQIVVRFDRARAAQAGVTMLELQTTLTTAFQGVKVAEIFEGQRVIPVVVKDPEDSRAGVEKIGDLPVRTPAGIIPLRALSDISVQDAPNLISRQAGARRLVVTCDSAGSVSRFSREIGRRLRALSVPPGYSLQISGDYEAQQRSLRELILMGAVALVGVVLLLLTDFRSLRLACLVLATLPLALVGGVCAAFISRTELSLGALVGFVTLFGITARNAIMLLSHYRHLEEVEKIPFGPDLVVRGALDRLIPILMTALVTGLALVPLVAGGNTAGQEIANPMAVVITGGLLSSTALTLVLLPAFYLRWGKAR